MTQGCRWIKKKGIRGSGFGVLIYLSGLAGAFSIGSSPIQAQEAALEGAPEPMVGVMNESEFLAQNSLSKSTETSSSPEVTPNTETSMEEWLKSQGGLQTSEPSEAKTPALELLEQQKKLEQENPPNHENEELHEHADPKLHAMEKSIESSVPDSHERGSRKERKFFKEHQLRLEIDKIPQKDLMQAPVPEKKQ